MSLIANTSTSPKYPSASFRNMGDTVAGRIVSVEDYQEKVFGSNELRYFPSGDPVMGVKVVLETNPGDESSRITLWAQGKLMLRGIAVAVKNAGASDLEIGADLAVKFSGYEGRAKVYQAAYSRPVVTTAISGSTPF